MTMETDPATTACQKVNAKSGRIFPFSDPFLNTFVVKWMSTRKATYHLEICLVIYPSSKRRLIEIPYSGSHSGLTEICFAMPIASSSREAPQLGQRSQLEPLFCIVIIHRGTAVILVRIQGRGEDE